MLDIFYEDNDVSVFSKSILFSAYQTIKTTPNNHV